MALSDIITAIKQQADREVALIQERAMKKKDEIKRATDNEIAAHEEASQKQRAERKNQMQKKADTQVDMEKRRALLVEKREGLDSVYEEVGEELLTLPKEKKTKLEHALEKKVAKHKGEKKASKKGGFIFIGENTEEDFTYPHLVQTVLRPATELEVASKLFLTTAH